MIQTVTPNLNVSAYITRCLKYVQDAFGSPNAGKSAMISWQTRTKFKHTDRDFPIGVYFIVWFDYWGTVEGVYANWGHVVICKDGTCYSSPFTKASADANVHDTLNSISEVERIYGCTFIGWSEDIAGLKVIEGEDMQDLQDQINALNDQLNQTNIYLGIEQAKNAEQDLKIAKLEAGTTAPVGEYAPYTGVPLFVKVKK